MEQFLIGNILLETDYADIPLLSEGNLRRFRWDGPWSGDRAVLKCICEPLDPYLGSPLVPENHVYGIYTHREHPFLVYHWGNQRHGFAVWPDCFRVSFAPSMYHQPPLREDWFFSVCAFHRQLLIRDACVLHASYVDIGGRAILFTGPSGVGKSTQAGLWVRHAGVEVINGDRAVLREHHGRWHVFGYPSCGTSGICINRTLPLKAVVVLTQGKENRVVLLSAAPAIRALVSATEFYPWSQTEFDLALRTATRIAAQTPVLQLVCRPDGQAVSVLKQYLEGIQNHDSV